MNEFFLEKANKEKPFIFHKMIKVKCEKNLFSQGDKITLDLGNHYVGYFSFVIFRHDIYIDAPVELEFKFFENKRDLYDNFENYHGSLCKSWLQRENIFIDNPGKVCLPRRYACRYITIEVKNTPRTAVISDFSFDSVSSADILKLPRIDIPDNTFKRIDEIAVNTLKNCMQFVFEDGPKRDRRLWLGDLRLEALTSYYTLRADNLVRRCLYFFAAGDTNKYGFVPSFVYTYPSFFRGEWDLLDYSLLFVVTVCDYFEHTGDIETIKNLLNICKLQLDSSEKLLDDKGIISCPYTDMTPFIDWCEGLEKNTALHGVYLYALDKFTVLLEKINDSDTEKYKGLLNHGRICARKELFDEKEGIFLNSRDNFQKNVHSQVWMILGGVLEADEAQKVLLSSIYSDDFLSPKTPYMQHYVCEAMIKSGLYKKAFDYIRSFWGKMADEGADTFYEIYSPDDPELSPYGDRMINSMCHAWSCTPAYFIRKYNEHKYFHINQ